MSFTACTIYLLNELLSRELINFDLSFVYKSKLNSPNNFLEQTPNIKFHKYLFSSFRNETCGHNLPIIHSFSALQA
jgi:hypothetical protein